jgi:hypothetical protein
MSIDSRRGHEAVYRRLYQALERGVGLTLAEIKNLEVAP